MTKSHKTGVRKVRAKWEIWNRATQNAEDSDLEVLMQVGIKAGFLWECDCCGQVMGEDDKTCCDCGRKFSEIPDE